MANKITIDTSALGITWTINTDYTLEIGEGFVTQTSGERLGNPANANLVSFNTPASNTDVSSTDPASGSTLTPINTAIVREIIITFNRTKIVVGTGNFTLKKTSDNSTVQTFAVPAGVTFQNNNQLAINITDLLEADTEYYLLADAGIATDFDGFAWDGISSTTELTFTAPSAPAISSSVPADNATTNTNETFSFTMDRSGLTIETGNIYLYNQTGPTLLKTYDVTTDLTYDGTSTFSLDITGLLLPSNGYYFTSDAGIITDNDELESSVWAVDEWNFTTSATFSTNLSNTFSAAEYVEDTNSQILNAPDVIAQSPSNTFELTISPTDNSLVDEMSSTGSGGTSTWTSGTKTLTLTGTPAQINSHLDALYLRPFQDVESSIVLVYTCTRDSDSHTSTKSQTVTCSATNAEITNMDITRYYYRNSAFPMFTTNTPFIGDTGVESTVSYTITLTSPDGQFGIPIDAVAYQDILTITGNKDHINAQFVKIYFSADDITSDSTFTYTQTRDGIQQINTTTDLDHGGDGLVIHKFDTTGAHTWSPTAAETTYNTFDVLLIGGGGGGHIGGGAGGQVKVYTGQSFSNTNTYDIQVGSGGEGMNETGVFSNLMEPENASGSGCYFHNQSGGAYPGVVASAPFGFGATGYDAPNNSNYGSVYEISPGSYWNGIGLECDSGSLVQIEAQKTTAFGNTLDTGDYGNGTASRISLSSTELYRADGGWSGRYAAGFFIESVVISGSDRWRYSTIFAGSNSSEVYADNDAGSPTVYLGGSLVRDYTTDSDADDGGVGYTSQANAENAAWDKYLLHNISGGNPGTGTLMDSLASGGGAGQGGNGYDGDDTTASLRGKGGPGKEPSIQVDYTHYGGGGGGLNGPASASGGGGAGYNADGAGSAATDGTDLLGGGGGAGMFIEPTNTWYNAGDGGDGRIVIVSRPTNTN